MAVERIDQISNQSLDLVIAVGEAGRLECVVESLPVDEETVLP